jgi:hypothetical protein
MEPWVWRVVSDGIEVVRQIAMVETWGNKRPALKDHPIEDVYMFSVYITENNSEFVYEPVDEDDSWFSIGSYEVPGFDAGIFFAAAAIIGIFVSRNKRRTKKYY